MRVNVHWDEAMQHRVRGISMLLYVIKVCITIVLREGLETDHVCYQKGCMQTIYMIMDSKVAFPKIGF